MSKSVLISIQPKWCELIASGKKTIEVRKSAPKLETPFKCYIYATKPKNWYRVNSWGYASDEILLLVNGNVKMCAGLKSWANDCEYEHLSGKVIGDFVCDSVDEYILILDYNGDNYSTRDFMYYPLKDACLTQEEIVDYGNGKTLYGWHISDLKIYDKPKELSEIRTICEGIKCDGCEYYYVENNESIGLFKDCLCGCEKPIKKAPQSWCYIEELEK